MNDESLELLQTKIAFLERATAELSDALFRQDREIQALAAQTKSLAERLASGTAEETILTAEQERPPHY